MNEHKTYRGLTSAQVEENRAKYGSNVLTPPKKESLWKKFLEKFEDPIIRILLLAWVLSMVISAVHCWGPEQRGFEAFLEPIGIFFAIFLASTIGFIFEVKAARAFEVLNTVNDDVMVTVERDGKIQQVSRKDIVVGDIVILNTGDEVPADGTLLETTSLQINESTLTGEPIISKTTVEADFDTEATYPSNRAMRGTTVVDGYGVMQVELVGDATEYGKVNQGALIDNDVETPLQLQLKRLAGVISKFGYAAAVIIFLLLASKAFLSGSPMSTMEIISVLLNSFMIAVTLIVVSVPEGLPMSVTLSLALSMNRMLKTNNLVRKMHACETMGAATVICTDKTGTLTQNRMQVYETNFFALENQKLTACPASLLIEEGIAVNSTANLNEEGGEVKTIGNPTEAALLLWLNKQGVDYAPLRASAGVVSQLTFSTERKYMATVVDSPLLGKKVLYVKGAPEIVLSLCKRVAAVGGGYSTVEESRKAIESRLLEYQSMAMRTLGFACCVLEPGDNEAPYSDGRLLPGLNLTFVGFVAISDPVRADVPEAVQRCLSAGVDVKIVTGDTPGTAREIGRQIGICNAATPDDAVITGPDFEALSDEEAAKRVMGLKIMCRARPMDKQRLVHLLQQQGAVVAVTGDGTNDAPALKAAQVGLSMGDGTSVAKEASDITIIDNSFGSITRAVMWGRSLYKNIQRFLFFQLTINVAACFIVMFGSLVGTSSPLTITQMLWVNLIMDTFAAAALASLPPSWAVMKEKPRKSGENADFIITRNMAFYIFGYAAVFVAVQMGLLLHYYADGALTPYEMSSFFTVFVMLQFWNMFNAKAYMSGQSAFNGLFKSPTFLLVTAIILVGQYLIVTYGGTMFNVVPLTASTWLNIILATSPVLILPEFYRLARKVIRLVTKKKQ
ncbi:MAG: calcium-translocating P-type ATPase, PMCA-type [Bacteroidaceae bacterium]|nr:calcium-translocating P-type ATPase, PMCA-type [Bacteroidaceae bacterium]